MNGGSVTLADRSLLRAGSAPPTKGATMQIIAGSLSYILPAPAGHWLPNSFCQVYRGGCAYDSPSQQQACLAHQSDCALSAIAPIGQPPWYCQEATMVQPCNWDAARGGDTSLLGQLLYQAPQLPEDADFPYACAAGLLGSSDPRWQGSSECAGLCPSGQLCPTRATTQTMPCKLGHFCPEGSSVPLACPAGSYSNSTSLASEAECSRCTVGHRCQTGSTEPTPCSPGTYSDEEGATDCTPCEAGSFQPGQSAASCEVCRSGFYCVEGSSAPLPCPAGSRTNPDFDVMTSENDCAECDAGTFCPTGTDEAKPCAPGTFSASSGASSCTSCPAGEYQDQDGQQSCQLCPGGFYCAAGSSSPLPCPAGTRTNPDLNVMTSRDDCVVCEVGTFCPTGTDEAKPCAPGTFGTSGGASTCTICPAGQYQDESGQLSCKLCPRGFYCAERSSAPLPCPAGSYSNSTNLASAVECTQCPRGHRCSTGSIQPMPCSPGTYSDQEGATDCMPCGAGSYQKSQSAASCEVCPAGTYAGNEGQKECIPCPYRLDSAVGGTTCAICTDGLYFDDSVRSLVNITSVQLFTNAEGFCKDCPGNMSCPVGSTLSKLPVPNGAWRASELTAQLVPCDSRAPHLCIGSAFGNLSVSPSGRRRLADPPWQDPYCAKGHFGPRCVGCVEDGQYFDGSECRVCPNLLVRSASLLCIAALAIALFTCSMVSRTRPWMRQWTARLGVLTSNLGIQAKLKIVISFYQVCAILSSVYGVSLDPAFTGWMDAFDVLSLDIVGLSYPSNCLGSMVYQLFINALWPFALVLGGSIFIGMQVLLKARCTGISLAVNRSALLGRVLDRSVYFFILVFYLTLPTIARTVFKARQCESFVWQDKPLQRISFLLADLKVTCNSGVSWSADAFDELEPYFWTFYVLWFVLVPLTFLAFLLRVRASVVNQRITGLANACRFLWRDYHACFHYWEVVDLVRKLLLTAVIIFVDVEYGSSKILRLVIAAIVSVAYLAVIAVAHPFRRSDDLYLACLSNLLLTCCFISGIVIQICEGGDDNLACKELIGLNLDWYSSTVFFMVFSMVMLVAALLTIIGKVLSAGAKPTFRLVSSGREPILELPPTQHFHAFISHVWSTGQDQVKCGHATLVLALPWCQQCFSLLTPCPLPGDSFSCLHCRRRMLWCASCRSFCRASRYGLMSTISTIWANSRSPSLTLLSS